MTLEMLKAQLQILQSQMATDTDCSTTLSCMRLFSMERLLSMSQDLIRIMGSRGYRQSQGVEKYWRDLMGLTMLGGTAELHKMVVFKEIVKKHKQNLEKDEKNLSSFNIVGIKQK